MSKGRKGRQGRFWREARPRGSVSTRGLPAHGVTPVRVAIARELGAIRIAKGATQADVAKHLDISQGAYSRMESGRSRFDIEAFIGACVFLGEFPQEVLARALTRAFESRGGRE